MTPNPAGDERVNPDRRPAWLRTALLIGLLYPVIGFISAALAAGATGSMVFIWRLSAFGFSGVAFAWHLWHERFRLGSPPLPAAWHTAAAAGLGGFALALAANIHDLSAPAGFRPKMLVALVAWPVITAAPAFVVALIAASLHGRWRGLKPTF